MLSRYFVRLATLVALLLWASAVPALSIKPYSAQELTHAQGAGAPVALHFRADWCPTCRAQDKAFQSLKTDPALEKISLLLVDYDAERELKRQMGVRSQSTVIVFKGKTEVARDGGSIDAASLKAVLMRAL